MILHTFTTMSTWCFEIGFSTATELASLIRCQEIQGVVKVQHAHVEEMLAEMRTV